MNKRQITISIVYILILLSVTILAACGTTSNPTITPAGSTSTSNGDAQALLDQQCSRCHPLSRVTSKTKTTAEWKITVDRMITHGAHLTSNQEQALIDYLAQNY